MKKKLNNKHVSRNGTNNLLFDDCAAACSNLVGREHRGYVWTERTAILHNHSLQCFQMKSKEKRSACSYISERMHQDEAMILTGNARTSMAENY